MLNTASKFRIIHFLILGFSACALANSSSLLLHHQELIILEYQLLLSLTVGAYLLAYLTPMLNLETFNWKLINKSRKPILLCIILFVSSLWSIILFSYTSKFITAKYIFILFSVIFITVFYFLRIRTSKRIYFGLREIPILKNILLASIWTVATTYIPLIGTSLNSDAISLVAVRFSYIFVLCLMSDNRDIEYDKAKGITTISLILGMKKTNYLIISILIGILVYIILQPSTTTIWTPESKLALFISVLITTTTLFLLKKNTKVKKATLMIDSNLLIHGLLLPLIGYL